MAGIAVSVIELISASPGWALNRQASGRRLDRQRMILTGQGSQCGCHLGKARVDVRCHGPSALAVVFMPGVGLGGREAEVALDPGQGS